MIRTTLIAALMAVVIGWVRLMQRQNDEPCSDPDIAGISTRFQLRIKDRTNELTITNRGVFKRDRDTFFWSLFSDQFGSNPNTPYLWNALPLFGRWWLPSPMWNLKRHDAVVLISRLPPPVEYFSLTTFALWSPCRGFCFSSIGNSVNNLNIQHTVNDGLFAHIVTANAHTLELLKIALTDSGIPENATNVAVVPSDLNLLDTWTYFEVVMRVFRFRNQTDGNEYIASGHPVFYITAHHNDERSLPTDGYKNRNHAENVNERNLSSGLEVFRQETLTNIKQTFNLKSIAHVQPIEFSPLYIQGLACLHNHTQCLGDCPDAAYFGPHIQEDSDQIETLTLSSDHEMHVITFLNHRYLNASTYSSLSILKSSSPILSKTRMSVQATRIGITNFDFPKNNSAFVSWAFTRNPEHCTAMLRASYPSDKSEANSAVDGCTVVMNDDVPLQKGGYMTYCERIYLNPITATGPDWTDILPAKLHHIDFNSIEQAQPTRSEALFARIHLPLSQNFPMFDGTERLKFLHIIKTGGEALQNYLDNSEALPNLDFSTCRESALSMRNYTKNYTSTSSASCVITGVAISNTLCGLNCECCANDIRKTGGGLHGTLIRSPRMHALSMFSHCHTAHYNTWKRIASDLPLYLVESVLHGIEHLCNSSCTGDDTPDWKIAISHRLLSDALPSTTITTNPTRVISMYNYQSHALTCSKKSKGSIGQHFQLLDNGIDSLQPDVNATLTSLHQLEWVGITDLYHSSLCLLHYQANQTMPKECDCRNHVKKEQQLGYFVEYRSKRRSPKSLPTNVLEQLDAHTAVDAKVFTEALRLLLARLRRVEEMSGISLLQCIDWYTLWLDTKYLKEFWTDGPQSLLKKSE